MISPDGATSHQDTNNQQCAAINLTMSYFIVVTAAKDPKAGISFPDGAS
jgi:hypothetical protein